MGRYSGKTCRLITMLAMTCTFFFAEILVGYISNSMALVADSFHMLSDVMSLLVGFLAIRISKRKTSKNTFGWARAEVLGALVNAVFLVALCFSILVESIKRLIDLEHITQPLLVLGVGTAGLLVNIIGIFLFSTHGHGHSHGGGGHSHGHSHGGGKSDNHKKQDPPADLGALSYVNPANSHSAGQDVVTVGTLEQSLYRSSSAICCVDNAFDASHDHSHGHSHGGHSHGVDDHDDDDDGPKLVSSSQLNMRGVFLHVMGDALGSVIVIISALMIWFVEGEWKYYIDPSMSIIMVIIILSTAIPLLKESAMILLQTVPTHIKVDAVQNRLISKIRGVVGVHEFHVWQLAGNRIIASAHIQCHNLSDYMRIANQVKEFFHNEGIHSTTIQPEFVDYVEATDPINDCMLECGPDKNCAEQTCCGKREDPESRTDVVRQRKRSPEQATDLTTQEGEATQL